MNTSLSWAIVTSLITLSLFAEATAFASQNYPVLADNSVKRMYPNAPRSAFAGSCTACHTAPPALNARFGNTFVNTLTRLGFARRGLNQNQFNQILADAMLKTDDADVDGDTNETEMMNGTDMSDALSNSRPPVSTPTPIPGTTPPSTGSGGSNGSFSKGTGGGTELNADANSLSGGCSGKLNAQMIAKQQSSKANLLTSWLMTGFIFLPFFLVFLLRSRKDQKTSNKNISILAWFAVLTLGAAGCSLKKTPTASTNGANADGSRLVDAPPNYSPTNLTQALNSAAKILVQRLPTSDEFQRAASGVAQYESVIREYLGAQEFLRSLKSYHQNLFELAGTDANSGGGAPINNDEPANLASYLIFNGLDYRDVVKASYCVDNNFQKIQCSGFANQATADAQAAGALTTRAFIKKWKSAFNFRIVKKTFLFFSCSEYPDVDDPGLTLSEIADGNSVGKDWRKTSGDPACYTCHRDLNSRAIPFFNYDLQGRYTTTTTNTTYTDAANPTFARKTDLLSSDSVVPVYHDDSNGGARSPMNSAKDYGTLISKSRGFQKCVAQRFTNYMFNQPITNPLPSDLEFLNQVVSGSQFNVKEVIVQITKSAAFINR